MSDVERCPRCYAELEFDEVDIGVGVQRGNYRCPVCTWMPRADSSEGLLEDDESQRQGKLTRHEQLEGLADRGVDTWDDYKGKK